MSEPFRRLVDSVRADALRTPQRVFEGGRTRHPTLIGYADAADVLETLKDDRKHTYPQREALSQALLAEYRKTGEHLWANLLIVGFYPALSHLRHRLICDSVDDTELDQLVIVSFFEALRSLKDHECRDRVAMRLTQYAKRRVFAELKAEREQAHAHRDIDATHLVEVETKRQQRRNVIQSMEFQLGEVLRLARKRGMSRDAADVFVTSLFERQLRDMADEEGAGDSDKAERAYQRLKRQRSRALRKVIELVDSPSPA